MNNTSKSCASGANLWRQYRTKYDPGIEQKQVVEDFQSAVYHFSSLPDNTLVAMKDAIDFLLRLRGVKG